MCGSEVFDLYRQLLAILGGSYALVRSVNFVWRWQLATRTATGVEALGRRYLVVQLLRLPIRRFTLDLLQILVLVAVLAYLLWLHV